jgi:hypothetical protein
MLLYMSWVSLAALADFIPAATVFLFGVLACEKASKFNVLYGLNWFLSQSRCLENR